MAVKKSKWSRLDNAAKIFPSSSRKTDTSVFRFYCELKELVEPELLQEAVNRALREFPYFRCVMRKGAFWYYLESTDLEPKVDREQKPLCPEIYNGQGLTLLFEVSYFDNRINLEIYHVLSDGTGALQFLKTIVYYYLKEAHREELPEDMVFLENDASFTEQETDAFSKYYNKKEKGRKVPGTKKAYRLRGRKNAEEELQTIEAVVDLPQALRAAREAGATLTSFLTALFIQAILWEMPVQARSKPIVIMVPVNLRKFFPTDTARNFFGLVDICYDCAKGTGALGEIIEEINRALKEKLTPAYLSAKMHRFAAIERNPFAKIAPLPLKNVSLRWARVLEGLHETAVISNMGKVTMPEELCRYIDLFGVLASTLKIQVCMCSFGDKLQIGFTSAFSGTDIQKNMVRSLTERGIPVVIRSNDFFREGGEENAALS